MKNNIKLLSLAMAGTLVLGGCALGTSANSDAVEQLEFSDDGIQSVERAEKTGTEQTEELTQDAETEVSEETGIIGGSAPSVAITLKTNEWYDSEGDVVLLETRQSKVEITSEGYSALKDVISEVYADYTDTEIENMLSAAQEHYDGIKDDENFYYFPTYYMAIDVTLARSDSSVISFRELYNDYSGGAHGMYAISGSTFDVESGKRLAFEDILVDAEGFYTKATEYIADKLKEKYDDALWENYTGIVSDRFTNGGDVNWYLDAAGIIIAYTPYEMGPYAMGAPEVTLPYADFAEYIDEKYIASHSELIAKVPENADISTLLGEDGSIMLDVNLNEYELYEVTVISGSSSDEIGSFSNLEGAYVVKNAGGRSFLVVSNDYMSDDYLTSVYEVTGGELRKCDELNNARLNGMQMGTDEVSVDVVINMLGTYSAGMVYSLNSEGMLEQKNNVFDINTSNSMLVMKELPVVLDGEETKLSVGTEIVVIGTDNIDTVYFELVESGETGEISVEAGDNEYGTLYIDGVSEYEYFDMIPYAG